MFDDLNTEEEDRFAGSDKGSVPAPKPEPIKEEVREDAGFAEEDWELTEEEAEEGTMAIGPDASSSREEEARDEDALPQKKKRHGCLTALIVFLLAILLVACAAAAGLFYVLRHPEILFKTQSSVPGEVIASDIVPAEGTVIPSILEPLLPQGEGRTPTPSPEQPQPVIVEDKGSLVNILLVGLDAFTDGRTSSGTQPHADTCMVATINLKDHTVDLTSIPRDLLTTTPGYRGFYKLNGTFNVGGGMEDIPAGIDQVRRTAEQWLGGISIPYYYAVNFQAVIDLMDAIGGINYNVELPYHSHSGVRISPGEQLLNGDAVLGYLRIRTEDDSRDRSRTARQRKMLVAIFQKLKNEGSLMQIPSLLSSVSGNLWTNTNLAQTASLVDLVTDLSEDAIGTHVLDGSNLIKYDWAFTYVYQQERIDLIREIYGLEVSPMGLCSQVYEKFLHNNGFTALKYIRQGEKVLLYVHGLEKDASTLDADEKVLYNTCYQDYQNLYYAYRQVSNWYSNHWEEGGTAPGLGELSGLEAALKASAAALAKRYGYPDALSWSIGSAWYEDPDINEVYVDFR